MFEIAVYFLLLLLSVDGHEVEEWYKNLQHYGPLKNDGWNARAMTLVSNYTYRIEELSCNANDEFLFVAKLDTDPPPPLGIPSLHLHPYGSLLFSPTLPSSLPLSSS
jgi:hypothetical protein